MLRRRNDEVLDLPPGIPSRVPVHFDAALTWKGCGGRHGREARKTALAA